MIETMSMDVVFVNEEIDVPSTLVFCTIVLDAVWKRIQQYCL